MMFKFYSTLIEQKLDFSFQIPFGILAKKYGSLGFLGWGMLINSIFGFLVPISAQVSVHSYEQHVMLKII
jgi:hypothetical protein